jgi:hypothetical protein
MSDMCKCGQPADKEVEVTHKGFLFLMVSMCRACFNESMHELAELRHEFNALLDKGVSREEANRILIAKIDAKT